MLYGLSPTETVAQPTEVLLHELLVHKVELEMQVEELQRVHREMEEARDRYWDLYDFAPVGYITISRECLISEINLAGAAMLGVDRNKLVNRRFSKFLSPLDSDRWHRLFTNIMEHTQIEKQEIVLEMIRDDASTFIAHLDCQRGEIVGAPPMLRLALIDIGQIKRAEAEMQDSRITRKS
ncbi:MAG: PAS domain-containing protein [Betaproteobacteria bacterium]|nr:PAS domain-containing protein [Betaproteobacteria bacterium]